MLSFQQRLPKIIYIYDTLRHSNDGNAVKFLRKLAHELGKDSIGAVIASTMIQVNNNLSNASLDNLFKYCQTTLANPDQDQDKVLNSVKSVSILLNLPRKVQAVFCYIGSYLTKWDAIYLGLSNHELFYATQSREFLSNNNSIYQLSLSLKQLKIIYQNSIDLYQWCVNCKSLEIKGNCNDNDEMNMGRGQNANLPYIRLQQIRQMQQQQQRHGNENAADKKQIQVIQRLLKRNGGINSTNVNINTKVEVKEVNNGTQWLELLLKSINYLKISNINNSYLFDKHHICVKYLFSLKRQDKFGLSIDNNNNNNNTINNRNTSSGDKENKNGSTGGDDRVDRPFFNINFGENTCQSICSFVKFYKEYFEQTCQNNQKNIRQICQLRCRDKDLHNGGIDPQYKVVPQLFPNYRQFYVVDDEKALFTRFTRGASCQQRHDAENAGIGLQDALMRSIGIDRDMAEETDLEFSEEDDDSDSDDNNVGNDMAAAVRLAKMRLANRRNNINVNGVNVFTVKVNKVGFHIRTVHDIGKILHPNVITFGFSVLKFELKNILLSLLQLWQQQQLNTTFRFNLIQAAHDCNVGLDNKDLEFLRQVAARFSHASNINVNNNVHYVNNQNGFNVAQLPIINNMHMLGTGYSQSASAPFIDLNNLSFDKVNSMLMYGDTFRGAGGGAVGGGGIMDQYEPQLFNEMGIPGFAAPRGGGGIMGDLGLIHDPTITYPKFIAILQTWLVNLLTGNHTNSTQTGSVNRLVIPNYKACNIGNLVILDQSGIMQSEQARNNNNNNINNNNINLITMNGMITPANIEQAMITMNSIDCLNDVFKNPIQLYLLNWSNTVRQINLMFTVFNRLWYKTKFKESAANDGNVSIIDRMNILYQPRHNVKATFNTNEWIKKFKQMLNGVLDKCRLLNELNICLCFDLEKDKKENDKAKAKEKENRVKNDEKEENKSKSVDVMLKVKASVVKWLECINDISNQNDEWKKHKNNKDNGNNGNNNNDNNEWNVSLKIVIGNMGYYDQALDLDVVLQNSKDVKTKQEGDNILAMSNIIDQIFNNQNQVNVWEKCYFIKKNVQ